ncbi:MAG: type II toxin-antitoxin system PemK/MazF family toxin [Trueperaceae bacterium]|nr:type II toxin-antitoxin system PemK/MazF family toxin [Trueperaceae bacterium]MCC6310017.1 type II toxin-antitoxin system PemK/MazF family toxin [Trueperaceae bacterium]MCW5818826.1 type II toxin-antitoxin system PemK/MazF family toxin [Trueperaceae bacterium]
MREDSVALCHQLTSLDRSKLAGWLGSLSDEALGAVERGLAITLDLPGAALGA